MAVILSGRKAKAEIAHTVSAKQVVDLIEQARRICVDKTVAAYIVRIVEATRTHADIKLGASPAAASRFTACPGPTRSPGAETMSCRTM